MTIEAGLYVTPNVKLVRPLGRGGMGSVWVAHHEGLDADVAVKFVATALHPGDTPDPGYVGDDPSVLERFKREAALSAKIKSPHVVKTFDHGIMEDGQPYIVMELLAGESLGARLGRAPRLSAREVALIISQTAQVLDEAHELGVVHRDIKPDNLFLIRSGYELFVKVLDFGIAKQTTKLGVSSVTDTGAIVGTPEYMSPEQLLSPRSADWRSDMWALAVLAYRALTGTVPFKGETLPSLSLSICKGIHEPPSSLVPGLPEGVDAWFARALHPEPKKRFATMTGMADAFLDVARASLDRVDDSLEKRSDPAGSKSREPGTLASAMSEARPVLMPRPEIAVETAADAPQPDPLAATTPGKSVVVSRRGPIVVEIDRPRSTPRPMSTERSFPLSTTADTAAERRHSRLKLAGVLLVAVMVAAAADLVLRGAGETPRPALGSSEQSSALVDELWEDSAPRPTARSSTVQVNVPPPAASPSAPPSPPSNVVAVRPPPPKPKTSASAKPACANPYITLPDGTETIKPECL